MEYNLTKQTAAICEVFLDTVNEQIVDTDISLPDYCPDIEKILKCTLKTNIYTRHISGGQLTVDGVSVVRVLYCDSVRHNLRCYETTVPFAASFNLKTTPEQYIILTDTKCEYINCRALSPRKMVIHGAFSLSAKVIAKGVREYYGYLDESDLQIKKTELAVSDMCAMCQEQFSVTEDIEITNKNVESLLTYDVSAEIKELKPLHNKLLLSADITFRALYLCDLDTGETDHISYIFPISRMIDCDSVTDDVVCVPTIEVMSVDVHMKNDSMSEKTTLNADLKMSFSSAVYEQKTIEVIEDAYSTCFDTELKIESRPVECNHSYVDFSNISKCSFDFGGIRVSKIIDVCAQGLSLTPVYAEQKLNICGKVTYCIFALTEDDVPVYIERSADVEFSVQTESDGGDVSLRNCRVHSISFRLADENTIEIRAELKGMLCVSDMHIHSCVSAILADEDKKVLKDDCALVLYFADKGESVWDIAKHYRTKQSLLIDENSLSDTVLSSSCMLLVPTE